MRKKKKNVQEYTVTQNALGMTCYALVPKKRKKPLDAKNGIDLSPPKCGSLASHSMSGGGDELLD